MFDIRAIIKDEYERKFAFNIVEVRRKLSFGIIEFDDEIDNRMRKLEGEEPISNRTPSSIPSPEYSSIPEYCRAMNAS